MANSNALQNFLRGETLRLLDELTMTTDGANYQIVSEDDTRMVIRLDGPNERVALIMESLPAIVSPPEEALRGN